MGMDSFLAGWVGDGLAAWGTAGIVDGCSLVAAMTFGKVTTSATREKGTSATKKTNPDEIQRKSRPTPPNGVGGSWCGRSIRASLRPSRFARVPQPAVANSKPASMESMRGLGTRALPDRSRNYGSLASEKAHNFAARKMKANQRRTRFRAASRLVGKNWVVASGFLARAQFIPCSEESI